MTNIWGNKAIKRYQKYFWNFIDLYNKVYYLYSSKDFSDSHLSYYYCPNIGRYLTGFYHF